MHIDLLVSLAGLIVGFVVGLTGMGGGALMTPILVILFGIQPLAAVSSDLVAAVIMKPVGGLVHARKGTVDLRLVKLLCFGSVPAAFCGVLVLKSLGSGDALQNDIKKILGVALLVAASAIVGKAFVQRGRTEHTHIAHVEMKTLPTIAIGVLGGFVVGMTSVGSGSLMIVLLLMLYPSLSAAQLVGTDLVQAVPLVLSAALGHILFGDFQLGLTGSLLIGSIPGVYLGAHASVKAPDGIIRPALVAVLALSALKLLGAGNGVLGGVLLAALVVLGVVALRTRSQLRGDRPAAEPQLHSEVAP